MATNVRKIDSSSVGLSVAEESTIQVLPVTPTWEILEPNEFGDHGQNTTLLARRPISSGKKRKKGEAVDAEAMAQFTVDLTPEFLDKMNGLFFSLWEKPPATTVSAATASTDDFTVDDETGFAAEQLVLVDGTVSNDG